MIHPTHGSVRSGRGVGNGSRRPSWNGGVILALLGIAFTILWPDRRWIGWTCLGAAIGLALWWVCLEFRGEAIVTFRETHPIWTAALVFLSSGAAATTLWLLMFPINEHQQTLTVSQPATTKSQQANPALPSAREIAVWWLRQFEETQGKKLQESPDHPSVPAPGDGFVQFEKRTLLISSVGG